MSTEDVNAEREGLVEEIARVLRPAIAKHVCNVSNFPDGMQVAALGRDMTPLIDGLADALADLLAARDRRVRAEAIWEYRDALADNESAENWCTRDAYLHDLVDWATYIEEADA